jgi:origin recognition complex subunit 4
MNLPFIHQLFRLDSIKFPKAHVKEWNSSVTELLKNEKVLISLQTFHDYFANVASLKLLLTYLVSNLSENNPKITAEDIIKRIDELVYGDDKVKLITGLSVLEICLLVAMKHHCDIYDNDPFNFEIILTRFKKFALKSTTMQNTEREIVLKRFENLKYNEIIEPIGASKVQKEYQMFKMLITPEQIDAAITKYQNLPTEIEQWSKSSIL